MSTETMVDFIVPMHNAQDTIARTIRSLLDLRDPRWRAIVIDDGCTDRSAEIVRTIDDPRVLMHHQANAGVSAARNHGFSLAQAPFVCFLDADDTIEPEYIEVLLPLAQGSFLGAACACDYLAPGGQRILPPSIPSGHSLSIDAFCALDCPPIMSIMHNRSAIAAVSTAGPVFDPALDAFEDLDLLIRLKKSHTNKNSSWAFDQSTLAHYWQTPRSLSSINPRVHSCGLEILRRYFNEDPKPVRAWTLRSLAASIGADDQGRAGEHLSEIKPLRESEIETLDSLLRWHICRRDAVDEPGLAARVDKVLDSIDSIFEHEPCIASLREMIGSWRADRWMHAVRVVNGSRSADARLVVYGLGRNGRRVIDACTKLGIGYEVFDDDPLRIPQGIGTAEIAELTRDDVVLVTPDNASAIIKKVRTITDARVWTIASALRDTADAPSPSAGV